MTPMQWSRWRRDLLVSLVASALTVTILVPLGWALLRQEQQQAAAQRDLAAQAVLRAEKGEAEAAKYKAQAEHNFQLARHALDEYVDVLVASKETPEESRKRFLEEAKKLRDQQK
jgi:hypothetical protein